MKSPTRKKLILVMVVIAIVVVIGYIQSRQPAHLNPSQAPDVVSPPITTAPAVSSPSTTGGPHFSGAAAAVDRTAVLAQKAKEYSKAKELVDPSAFINTDPFTLSQYVGKKVILVDFWTYSCINCERTIPYLNAWYQKYKDDGLLIVGVHTPEFDFEKNLDNVTAGVRRLGIKYPVVLDNDHGTWDAYQNQYWPHEYLIDIDGYVVHDHIGEGDYAATEHAIQQALQERSTVLGLNEAIATTIVTPSDAIAMDPSQVQSPETYVGYARDQLLANGTPAAGVQTFTLPSTYTLNNLYLGGTWSFAAEY
ncbi:MAG TPA: redoxin domain-containing protein, partial [Candidatus Paceibacterota bacterium]|nr:redoxin domain-containing protein [Candidatus Paceibacterota bacterium]